MPKLIDAFLFTNEHDITALRLMMLNDVVDHFYILEATETFTGNKRVTEGEKLLKKFAHLKNKITYIKYESFIATDPWQREYELRNNLEKAFDLCEDPQDCVMISDADEIPNPDLLKRIKTMALKAPLSCTMLLSYFKLNYICHSLNENIWVGTVICPKLAQTKPQTLRNNRGALNLVALDLVDVMGWHFSYFGDETAWKNKLSSFAHQEKEVQDQKNITIQTLIESNHGPFAARQPYDFWAPIHPEEMGHPAFIDLYKNRPDFFAKPISKAKRDVLHQERFKAIKSTLTQASAPPIKPSIDPIQSKKSTEITIHLDFPNKPARNFIIRKNSIGDRGVVDSILINQDYNCAYMRQMTAFSTLKNKQTKSLIIDAGANIGAASVYFHHIYPSAHIVAIEPEKGNIELLKRNTNGIDIDILPYAISDKKTSLFLSLPTKTIPDASDWSFQTSEKEGDIKIEALSMLELYEQKQQLGYEPLICKIDIEGGETRLFQSNTEWVKSTPLIIIEIHDWLLTFEASSKSFFQTLSSLDFDIVLKGENLFCFNNTLLQPTKAHNTT